MIKLYLTRLDISVIELKVKLIGLGPIPIFSDIVQLVDLSHINLIEVET